MVKQRTKRGRGRSNRRVRNNLAGLGFFDKAVDGVKKLVSDITHLPISDLLGVASSATRAVGYGKKKKFRNHGLQYGVGLASVGPQVHHMHSTAPDWHLGQLRR